MRVFLVDDSMFIITQLSQMLAREGHEIVGYAVDGREAVEKFASSAVLIDLVTIDLTLPGLDGIEVLRRMRELKPQTRFVIISAIGKKDAVLRSKELGAAGYIIKPLSTEKVLPRLREILAT
jgi:two-component system chemotaxis response regulator CheY